MRRITLLIGLVALSLLNGCGRNLTHETVLPNGLKVVVQEDHRSPIVVSQIWYKVGGMDEPRGITGVSHVLEHMMFKGTTSHGPNEFSRIIAENGGRENAFTSRDYTAYFQTLEKSRLPIALELEADRMRNLLLDDKELRKELQVVMEERRLRTEDQPEGRLYEKFSAAAYTRHPYGNPIIGWMEDLQQLKVDDVRRWYRQFYAPNNATLVVAGDVDPDEVVALAQKYFGAIPREEITRPDIPDEPPQTAARRVTVAAPAQVPQMMMGFHVPSLGQADKAWEPYALDVLAGVLDSGKSARLSQVLVRETQVAASANAGYSSVARGPSQFMLNGTPATGRSVNELEQALLEQIRRLQAERISDAELQRVKAQVASSDVFQRDSVFYQAMELGTMETVGLDRRLINDYVDRINEVTAAQVQAVAKKYLVVTNMTVAELKPQPVGAQRRRPAPVGDMHAH
jgi:zinc protease